MKLRCDLLDTFRTIDDPDDLQDHLSALCSEAADAATEERPSSLRESRSGILNGRWVMFGFRVRFGSNDLAAAAPPRDASEPRSLDGSV